MQRWPTSSRKPSHWKMLLQAWILPDRSGMRDLPGSHRRLQIMFHHVCYVLTDDADPDGERVHLDPAIRHTAGWIEQHPTPHASYQGFQVRDGRLRTAGDGADVAEAPAVANQEGHSGDRRPRQLPDQAAHCELADQVQAGYA